MNRNFSFMKIILFIVIIFCITTANSHADYFSENNVQSIKLENITFNIDGIGSSIQLRNRLLLKKGDVITRKDIFRQIQIFNREAFYKSITWVILNTNPEKLILHFDFVINFGFKPIENEEIKIDRVLISGNWKTLDNVILKEFLFQEDDNVSTDEIIKSIQRIRNLDFFFYLDWGLIYLEKETILQILVAEKWTTFPIIYVQGDDEVTELKLGAVDLNLFGLGLFLQVDYTGFFSESPLKNNFNVNAQYSNLLGSRLNFQTEFGINENLNEISNQGVLTAGFNHYKIRFMVKTDYDTKIGISPGVELDYSHNVYSGDDVNINYSIPYSYTAGILSPTIFLSFDKLNLIDHRKSGFYSKIAYSPQIPLYGEESLFHKISMEMEFHKILPLDWFFFKGKGIFDYSSSLKTTGYDNLSNYLRGGSGKTIYDPYSAGLILEAGFTPLNFHFLTLDIKAVADLSMSGNFVSDPFSSDIYWRLGPGINITFPFIAEFNLSIDLIWTEKGNLELYFGMLPFFR
jgi:outer membrane protein assembly factor BamA